MPFFSKSCSQAVYDASSVGESSTSLIPQEKKPAASSHGEFYVSLSGGSQSQSQSKSQSGSSQGSNVKIVRAKDLGALQNKYGAIGYGSMSSIV
ncbi:hypothetical protein CTheo_1540 [Ceratobasidium theobromae]|uniref:Uncharacterized protein n=1 Tax=Ceratobasidium theobromae TaxID=1582974 RepID=A0A5N5QTX3_9AGAM|nr:hypothetical protein CTheo_1540 [Ceratobasidium theobromae]